jgi:hypothetical protein
LQGRPGEELRPITLVMLSPCLVHFPDREPRLVMNVGGAAPRAGDEFIQGWVDERHMPAEKEGAEYDLEVWVRPKAA